MDSGEIKNSGITVIFESKLITNSFRSSGFNLFLFKIIYLYLLISNNAKSGKNVLLCTNSFL